MNATRYLNGPTQTEIESAAYQDECVFALEPSIHKLLEIAVEVGWDKDQVLFAIMLIIARQVTDNPRVSDHLTRRNDLQ